MNFKTQSWEGRWQMSEHVIAGKGTYFAAAPNLQWAQGAKMILGKYCSVAPGLVVYLHGNHHLNRISAYPEHMLLNRPLLPDEISTSKGDIIIGNDVWIGQNTIIMSGTKIGNGAIIGAFSVVRGYIPSYWVSYGNPCAEQHPRYSEEQRIMLEEMKWWDWNEALIPEFYPFIKANDVQGLYDFYLRRIKHE